MATSCSPRHVRCPAPSPGSTTDDRAEWSAEWMSSLRRFVVVEIDPVARPTRHISSAMTEAEARAILKARGIPAAEIDRGLTEARQRSAEDIAARKRQR